MSIVLGLLAVEYYVFRQQAIRMAELKEDYRNHLAAVKRVLSDYYKIKERLVALEDQAADEKKNDIGLNNAVFPEGVRIYSSDELDDVEFVVVNRDLTHLKQSTIDYLEETNLDSLLSALNVHAWKEYTDELYDSHTAKPKKGRAKSVRKKRSSSASRDIAPLVTHKRIQDLSLTWPLERSQFWISSHYGPRRKQDGSGGFHYGIDMAAVRGTPVYAAAAGVVVQTGYVSGYGNMIVIEHNSKYRTRYAHLDKILVKVGTKVAQNDRIGKVGDTGFIRKKGRDGSHLHFEVLAFGKQMNPLYVL
jgi:murein DD-endopeptidase MepM/ murein hydrolase activator NlpD